MSDVYTVSLWLGTVQASTVTALPPTPSGETFVVTCITARQAVAAGHYVSFRALAGNVVLAFFDFAAAPDYRVWTGRIALPSGTTSSLYAVGATADVSITGFLLGAPPG